MITVGQTVHCSTGTWAGPPDSYAYQWQHSPSPVGPWNDIAGATASSYLVQESDDGQYLRCVVTATNLLGTATATSNVLSAVGFSIRTDVLGCGVYDVYVLTRGGATLVAQFPWTSVEWARVLDDTSEASADAVGYPPGCCDELSQIRPWRHELAIYRDGDLVWVGPIREPKAPPPFTFQIAARDLTSWWDHRLIHDDHRYATPTDLATIFQEISDDAMAPDPSPGLTVSTTPTGITAVMEVLAVQHALAGPKLRDIANTGIDWTAVGRDVLAGGLVVPTGSIGTFLDAHFAKPPTPRLDGSSQANSWLVRGSGGGAAGDTIYGTAAADQSVIDDDGLLESVDTVSTLQDNASALAAAQSRLAITQEVVLVEDCVLAPEAPFTIDKLVPGALCELALEQTCIPVFGEYRLYKVSGRGSSGGDGSPNETVTLTFQPAGTM